ncbi:MAG: hypothetical protein AAB462_00400 [Patescibacteria group bacterium]
MPEEASRPEAKEAQIAALRERRKDAAVPAGIYAAASAFFLVQACDFNIGLGHGNTNILGAVGLAFAVAASIAQVEFQTAGNKIRKIEQQDRD